MPKDPCHNQLIFLSRVLLCLAVAFLTAAAASAQVGSACGEQERKDFQADLESGASDEELEAKYAKCRGNAETPALASERLIGQAPTTPIEEFKFVIQDSIGFEQMTGCGYHPQAEMVACDVQLNLPFGYGGFPAPGSTEHVLFCWDCDLNGTFEYTTRGNVHVTDQNPAVLASLPVYQLAFSTTFDAPPGCTVNNGGNTNMLAILQWALPPASCFTVPFFGNRIFETLRRDP